MHADDQPEWLLGLEDSGMVRNAPGEPEPAQEPCSSGSRSPVAASGKVEEELVAGTFHYTWLEELVAAAPVHGTAGSFACCMPTAVPVLLERPSAC